VSSVGGRRRIGKDLWKLALEKRKERRDPGFKEDGMTDGLKALTTRF